MDALTLSGGGIRGGWQAGVAESVYASGYRPQIITGISVGALNAAFLAAYQDGVSPGRKLAEFWETQVTSPSKFVTKRRWYELLYRLLFKRWDGLVGTDPLTKVVHEVLGPHFPMIGRADVRVGSVNLQTGELVYTPADSPDFLDAVLASSAEPIAMPLRKIQGVAHYDGGLRDITPLKQAITMGATRIIAVVCQQANLGAETVREGNLMGLLTRVLGIATNEIGRGDFGDVERINADLRAGGQTPSLEGKRRIDLTVIRPRIALGIDLESFTAADIRRTVDQGRTDGRAALEMDLAA